MLTEALKPFDLAKALMGQPVVRGNGQKVELIRFFDSVPVFDDTPVLAINDKAVTRHDIQGRYYGQPDNELNLYMAAQVVTKWINMYKSSHGWHVASILFESEKEAKSNICGPNKYIATLSITFEE